MKFVPRAEWGSVATSRTLVVAALPELYIHHTGAGSVPNSFGSEMSMMRSLQAYAIRDKALGGKGYNDLDYNLIIGGTTGYIYEGRGIDYGSAATLDRNKVSRSICVMGNYENAMPPEVVITGIVDATRMTINAGRLTPDVTIRGHRDNPAHPLATSCPGHNLYVHIQPIIRRVLDKLPSESEAMNNARMVRHRGYLNVWLVGAGPALHLSPELADSYTTDGVRTVLVADHPQLLAAMLFQSGLTRADLVPGGT